MYRLSKRVLPLIVATIVTACGPQPPQSSVPRSSPQPEPAPSSVVLPPTEPVAPDSPTADSTGDTMTKLATSINRLAFDLFPKLSRAQPGNLVFSPASISFALSMTWGGADGQTAKEMQQVLHFESSSSEVMEASGKLIAALTDRSRPITFRVANQLFGEKTYPFEPSFLSQTARAFGAPMQQVNFKTAHEPTRRLINELVEQ